jgi:dolichol kinase
MLNQQELRRQLIHAATALIPLLYLFFPDIGPLSGQQWVMILFLIFGGTYVLADYLRRHNETIRRIFMWIVSPFIREVESRKMTAASNIAMSFFLVLLIFPPQIAVPACLLLSIADAASGIVGRWIGKHKWYKDYTIEGTLAFILAGLLLFLIAFPYIAVWKAVLVVAFCALFEVLLSHLNDNFVIPISAAIMLMMLEV